MPNIGNDSEIPGNMSEIIKSPQDEPNDQTYLVEVQDCTQRSQRGSDMLGTHMHAHSVQISMKNSRSRQHTQNRLILPNSPVGANIWHKS